MGGVPHKVWSGSCHRNASTCKAIPFMVVGTERPRALPGAPTPQGVGRATGCTPPSPAFGSYEAQHGVFVDRMTPRPIGYMGRSDSRQ